MKQTHDQWLNYISALLERRDITPDAGQVALIRKLESLSGHLSAKARLHRRWRRTTQWLRALQPRRKIDLPPWGVYLWGEVGSGKTLILEAFHRFLPHTRKKHFHFHRFMRMVHKARHDIGGADPLATIARDFSDHAVFLDEFMVDDIGDAMLLGGLLQAMRENNVVLLTTSNTSPDSLYLGGLQRERFLPTIALINEQLAVFHLESDMDYRMRLLREMGTFHKPCDERSNNAMLDEINSLGVLHSKPGRSITVNGRDIPTIRLSDNAVWFSFDTLCGTARSSADYIRLAGDYPTIFLSGVPNMDGNDDAARRFIHLIDVLYEHRVKLILSAEAEASGLYGGGRLRKEFQRTISRLTEINSEEYLSRGHKPHEN